RDVGVYGHTMLHEVRQPAIPHDWLSIANLGAGCVSISVYYARKTQLINMVTVNFTPLLLR
ncbi:MAG: hypothetical protein V3R67_05810, partial [Thermodesulfobacteriota bacterium]